MHRIPRPTVVLGWLTRTAPERVHAVGLPLWMDAEGWLREGRILDIRRT